MRPRESFTLPAEQQRLLKRARALEWWSIGTIISIIIVMYLVMGSSQAMKAAWVEDVLDLIPPLVFLLVERFHGKQPSQRFPWGYRRAPGLAFLGASVALALLGVYLIVDSTMTLLKREHASIGSTFIFGHQVWMGWFMIAALLYSAIPPFILGRMKLKVARGLNDKTLHANAVMNKADWMTSLAATVGVVGIGFGLWWLDAAAALFIATDILRDGIKRLGAAIMDLLDQRPSPIGDPSQPHPVIGHLCDAIGALPWVEDVSVNMRTEGRFFTGEVFVRPKPGTHDLVERLGDVRRIGGELDWRLQDITPTLIEPAEWDSSDNYRSSQ